MWPEFESYLGINEGHTYKYNIGPELGQWVGIISATDQPHDQLSIGSSCVRVMRLVDPMTDRQTYLVEKYCTQPMNGSIARAYSLLKPQGDPAVVMIGNKHGRGTNIRLRIDDQPVIEESAKNSGCFVEQGDLIARMIGAKKIIAQHQEKPSNAPVTLYGDGLFIDLGMKLAGHFSELP